MARAWNSVGASRWQEAQQHELQFWRAYRTLAPYRRLDFAKHWAGERVRFGLPEDFFEDRVVLEVGSGPVGMIHFIPEAALRIRLDALMCSFPETLPLDEPALSIAATGERLPLACGAVDVAICFNALDHMQDPRAALSELARVLRPGGTLMLNVHTFPAWVKPLLGIDRTHPHHWTHAEFRDHVASVLRVVWARRERHVFDIPWRERLHPASWKYVAAGLVLATTYLTARRER
jgi:SAM-dependent methyltransferase